MAQKLLKRKPRKVAPKNAQVEETGRAACPHAAVLVGTYKAKQLSWIKRHGIYNYPVKDGDFSRVERVDGVGGFRIGHERASNRFETAWNVFAIAS